MKNLKTLSLKKNTCTTLRVISTLLLIAILVMCFLPNWGGYSEGHYFEANHRYVRVSFFRVWDMYAWLIGFCTVISIIFAVVVLWTKMYKTMIGLTCFDALSTMFAYIILENRGSVFELGLIHLIASFIVAVISVILYIDRVNSK